MTIPKSQIPDQRMFVPLKDNRWVSNRTYKTANGAETLMYRIGRDHPRKNVTMLVKQSQYDGLYRVYAYWIGGTK